MKNILSFFILFNFLTVTFNAYAQDAVSDKAIFDDKQMHDGYTERFRVESKATIIAMIKDDTLDDAKMAAAVRVLKEKYIQEIFDPEKTILEKVLWRRLARTNSPLTEVEIMHTLCRLDRYQYFPSLMPTLILKLDHYNATVNEIVFAAVNDITAKGSNKTREARIVFNTLRKVFFLSRRRLKNVTEPDERLKQKLTILRWSLKVLGTQEIRRLPPEVINLI